jgi:hypothetical protein
MRNDEILPVIEAAKSAGSFKLKLVFAMESAIRTVQSFVTMPRGGRITVDDETMMTLRLVAITRRWPDDTDRIVVMTMEDDFDPREFIAKFEFALEGIEAMPGDCLDREGEKHEGTMNFRNAIRDALTNNKRNFRIIFPKVTDTDLLLFMDLVKHDCILFTRHDEQIVFEAATRGHRWLLGGRLSADIFINRLPEHAGSRITEKAHVRVKTARIVR